VVPFSTVVELRVGYTAAPIPDHGASAAAGQQLAICKWHRRRGDRSGSAPIHWPNGWLAGALYTLTNVLSARRRVPSPRQEQSLDLASVVMIDEVLMVMLAFRTRGPSCTATVPRRQLDSTRGSERPVRPSSLVCHARDELWPKCLGGRRFASCHTLAGSKRITQ